MLTRPTLRPGIRAQVVGPDSVVLLSEPEHLALTGRLYPLVIPLLDGGRTADEIVDCLEGEAAAAEVYHALGLLEGRGLIVETTAHLPAEQAAFWQALGLDPSASAGRLGVATVTLVSYAAVPSEEAIAALSGNGVTAGPAGDFALVLADSYLDGRLDAFNRAALATGRPWLLVRPSGVEAWLGPLFRPGVTGCWECLAQRLRGNRPVEAFFASRNASAPSDLIPVVSLPSTSRLALDLAATETARWLAGGGSPLEGHVLSLDLRNLDQRRHTLVRRPQCPRCAAEAIDRGWMPAPPVLQRRSKRFTEDGGHRSCPPEETVQRFQHHISPVTGVVRDLRRLHLPGGEAVVHTYAATHAFPGHHRDLAGIRWGLSHTAAGKGMSDAQARASALCEGLERYSATWHGDEPVLRAKLDQLGDDAIHPNACMNFSPAQYARRDAINAAGSAYQQVPPPFDPTAGIDWTPVWSLTRGRFRYLPSAYCWLGYPASMATACCFADSNGNAAGNTLEEAVVQGLLELIERDAVAVWWYNRVRRSVVDLDSFDEPYLARIREVHRSMNRGLWVLDITSDLGIPAFAAISRRTDGPGEQILVKFGAHLDARIAVLRAVTEVNQHLPWAGASVKDGGPGAKLEDPYARWWWEHATVEAQPYLLPAADVPARCAGDYPRARSDDLLDDITYCRQIIERCGMEVLVLDQTRADIGLPVVKVIVPGLRHFWSRLAPGRLYDVPVQLGWLPRPYAEHELNPVPISA
jgi:oxazoline/thiazoline synthase